MRFVLVFILLTNCISLYGQLGKYSFEGSSGNEVSLPPDEQPTNGTLSDITRGSGLNPAASAGEFSSNNWSVTTLDTDDYYAISISSNSGFELSLTSIEFDERRSGSGIRDWTLRSNLDGFSSDILSFNVPDNSNVRPQSIPLGASFSNIPSSQTIEFRFYGFNSESTSGTWWVDNIVFFGSIEPPDNQPPLFETITVISQNSIIVSFDEALEKTSAEDPSNYVLNTNKLPISVTQGSDLTMVTLIFQDDFTDGLQNVLQVSGVQDLIGNVSGSQNGNFIFDLISDAQFNDIVINEIMADPTPVVGLPDAEYVELHNVSTKKIDLKNFTLNEDVITPESILLLPGEYITLTDDSNAGLFTGNVIEMTTMGALTNSGETLILKDADNQTVIDELTYTNDWYKDDEKDNGGYSLERVGPDSGCGIEFSWIASEDTNGGTPGLANSVDQTSIMLPSISLSSFNLSGSNSLELTLANLLNHPILASNIIIQSLNVQNVKIENSTVNIIFTQHLTSGTFYELTLTGLTNCDNSPVNDIILSFGNGATPSYNELLISEIMANPSENSVLPETEYLELFNPTEKTISLDLLTLSDASSTTTLPSALIEPNSYILLSPNSGTDVFSQFGPVVGVSNWPSLNNSGDVITIRLGDEVITSVAYEDSWYKDSDKAEGGWALEMVDLNNPCGGLSNWSASNDPKGGTPGAINSISNENPDNMGPRLLRSELDQQQLLLTFSEKLNPSINGIEIEIEPQIDFSNVELVRPSDDQITLTLNEETILKTIYEVEVSNIADCLQNIIIDGKTTFTQPEPADSLDLIINEILFNPRPGGVDFVEIFNKSDKYINMENYAVGQMKEDSLVNTASISESTLIIPPSGYLVFTQDPDVLKADYPMGIESNFIKVDLPSLPNDEGNISIIDNTNKVLDAFQYQASFHFSLLNDVEGVSLERISTEKSTQSEDNWHSAASTAGFATPGKANSQQTEIQTDQQISIVPRVIVPDNDGIADFATISYSFQSRGNIASLSIFDISGRPIKKLLNNASVGSEGFVTWDGTNDRFQKVRIGKYIVLLEVFDAEGNAYSISDQIVVGTIF